MDIVMLGMDPEMTLDAAAQTVAVSCGITTTQLLAWLGGQGWTLRTVPWWVGQTVCGAVATGAPRSPPLPRPRRAPCQGVGFSRGRVGNSPCAEIPGRSEL